jgi:hypothetical protein
MRDDHVTLWIAYLILCSASVQAEESKPQTTKKAVLEISKSDGFKLSDKAIQTIGVMTQTAEADYQIILPKEALVQSLNEVAIYRLRNGWFKLIPIEKPSYSGAQVTVRSREIKSGDRIATAGVALLRVTEMQAFGGGQ